MTDTITKTVDFGLDIDGSVFDVSVAVWSDGMTSTSASFDHETYDPLLVTATGPTIFQITDAIEYARQTAWEIEQEIMQG